MILVTAFAVAVVLSICCAVIAAFVVFAVIPTLSLLKLKLLLLLLFAATMYNY